jgi:hypothetical protein
MRGRNTFGLAGMPDGFTISRGAVTSTPSNSPVEAGLALVPGGIVQFFASGTIAGGYFGDAQHNPVGPAGWQNDPSEFLYQSPVPPGVGVSSVMAAENALIGVFLGPLQPAPPLPPALDFSGGAGVAVTSQPLLQQPFYIGTGETYYCRKKSPRFCRYSLVIV